jgi:capsular polysaccharide biosynthesis protein
MSSIEGKTLIRFMKKSIGSIIIVGLFFALISFFLLISTEKRFKAKTDFLIVQDQMGTQDFYSLSKSAEFLGGVLGEVVYSSVFIEEVIATGKVDSEFFPLSDRERLRKWKKIVKIESSPRLGIIRVEVFESDYERALNISEAIAEIMTKKNYLFRGKVNLDVRILTGPIIERNPDNEKIALVVVSGFILGALLKVIQLYYLFVRKNNYNNGEDMYLESLIQQEKSNM